MKLFSLWSKVLWPCNTKTIDVHWKICTCSNLRQLLLYLVNDNLQEIMGKIQIWKIHFFIYWRKCLSDKITPIFIFFISLKLWPYYTTGQWGEYIKICLLNAFKYFYGIFVVFYHKICVFVIFTSFFDEVSKQTQ